MHTLRNHSRLAATVLMAFAGVTSASAATLSVGPGKTYAKPCCDEHCMRTLAPID